MSRPTTLAVTIALGLALSAGATTARAAELAKDSPIGHLVGLVMAMQACGSQATPVQLAKLQTTGEALQTKLGATDADLDTLSKQFGDGKPEMGCDKFNADFNAQFDAAMTSAQ